MCRKSIQHHLGSFANLISLEKWTEHRTKNIYAIEKNIEMKSICLWLKNEVFFKKNRSTLHNTPFTEIKKRKKTFLYTSLFRCVA